MIARVDRSTLEHSKEEGQHGCVRKVARARRLWEQTALFRPVSYPSKAPTNATILCRSTARRSPKRQLIVVGLVTTATFGVHMSFALFVTKLAMIITSIALGYYRNAITSSPFRWHFWRRVWPERCQRAWWRWSLAPAVGRVVWAR